MPVRDSASEQGRAATRPSQLRWADWKAILLRLSDNLGYHNVYLIAAGVAFFGILALFPAIGALVGLYGIISDPNAIMAQLRSLQEFLPPDAYGLIETQVTELVAGDSPTLSIASFIALALAIWSARAGVGALVDGINITYSERNDRGMVAYYALTLLLTVVMVFVMICAILAIVVVPAVLEAVNFGSQVDWIVSLVRWPVVVATLIFGLGVLYRYAPHRTNARLGWLSWGAAFATALWLVGSLLFSWYVSNFANYNATYGSLGAIVGLMMWFYVSAYAVLLGAELNAEMEHQTGRDTTVGEEKPFGERGAYVADHVPGRSPDRDQAYKDVGTR